MFDLLDTLAKPAYLSDGNPVTLKVLEELRPVKLDAIDATAEALENLRMKLTAKLAKHGFDIKYFLETVEPKGRGTLEFVKLLAALKERLGLYLS